MKNKIVLLFIIISLIGALPIWIAEYPPLQDYPVHLLQANIFLQYENTDLNYQKDWFIQQVPVPYMGFFILTIFFGQFFNIFIAGKLTLTTYLILFPLSILYFITAFKNKKEILAFFAFLFMYNRAFFAGEINFVLGVTTFFFAMGYWFRLFLKNLNANILEKIFLSSLITITYMTHLTAFAFTSAVISFSILLKKSINRSLYFILPLFIPSVIFILLLIPKNVSPSELTIDFATPFDIAKRLLYFFSGYNPRLDLILLIPALILYVFLLLKGAELAKNNKQNTILIYAFLASFFVLLITPNNINPYVGDIPERIFFVLLLFGLPLLAVPKNKKVFTIILISIFFMIIFVKTYQLLDENEQIKLILSSYDKIPDKQNVFFIREKIIPRGIIVPSYHLWAYHNIKNGRGPSFLNAIFMPVQYHGETKLSNENINKFPYLVVLGRLSNNSQPQYDTIWSNNLTEVYKLRIT